MLPFIQRSLHFFSKSFLFPSLFLWYSHLVTLSNSFWSEILLPVKQNDYCFPIWIFKSNIFNIHIITCRQFNSLWTFRNKFGEMSKHIIHRLFIKLICSGIHNHWGIHKVVYPVRTTLFIQSKVPVYPSCDPVVCCLKIRKVSPEKYILCTVNYPYIRLYQQINFLLIMIIQW